MHGAIHTGRVDTPSLSFAAVSGKPGKDGKFDYSGARQRQRSLGPIPEGTLVAAIGPQTQRDAATFGLRVDVVARDRTAESLIDAVVEAALARA